MIGEEAQVLAVAKLVPDDDFRLVGNRGPRTEGEGLVGEVGSDIAGHRFEALLLRCLGRGQLHGQGLQFLPWLEILGDFRGVVRGQGLPVLLGGGGEPEGRHVGCVDGQEMLQLEGVRLARNPQGPLP